MPSFISQTCFQIFYFFEKDRIILKYATPGMLRGKNMSNNITKLCTNLHLNTKVYQSHTCFSFILYCISCILVDHKHSKIGGFTYDVCQYLGSL